MTDPVLHAACLSTPLGPFLIAVNDEGALVRTAFASKSAADEILGAVQWDTDRCAGALDQFATYFAGHRRAFDLPLAPSGTPFQLDVWRALCTIPYGITASYGALAARLGTPGAARAVGRANALNPLPVVVPCHRVLGADGSLTGFRGGVHLKAALLAHEGVHLFA
jgi:methylated-DNA-[protein]-cysteine S-methyltransferase